MSHTTLSHNAPPVSAGTAGASTTGSVMRIRLISLVIFTATMSLLLVAAWLKPDIAGTGTHSELGLPSCAFLDSTGLPCATCGMTTSFALAADGRVLDAIINQPAGGMLAILAAVAAVGSGFTLITGLSMWPLIEGICRPKIFLGAGIFFALAWIYKIAMVKGFF